MRYKPLKYLTYYFYRIVKTSILILLLSFNIFAQEEEVNPTDNFYVEINCDNSAQISDSLVKCDTIYHFARNKTYSVVGVNFEAMRFFTGFEETNLFPDFRFVSIYHAWEKDRKWSLGLNYGFAKNSIYLKEDMVYGHLKKSSFTLQLTKLFLDTKKVQPLIALSSGVIINKYSYLEQLIDHNFILYDQPHQVREKKFFFRLSFGANYNFKHHFTTLRYSRRSNGGTIEFGYGYRFQEKSQQKFMKKKTSL